MKKLLLFIVVIFLTGALFAQPKSNYEKYYETREAQEGIQQDTIVKPQPVNPVVKPNKPHTIFNKSQPEEATVEYANTDTNTDADTDSDINVYIVEPFDYSMFYSPFAFSFGLWGYPYYGYGYPFYDPWFYPYYGYGYGYPYYGYGYPYYGHGYGGGYYSHYGDRDGDHGHGHGMLGWHGYGNTNNKNFANSYPMTRNHQSINNFASRSRSQQTYTDPSSRPTYRQGRTSVSTYTRPEMSTRPKYNNTQIGRNSSNSTQRTIAQPNRRNSFGSQQRSRTSTQSSQRSYSAPSRSSAPASRSYSAPASRSYSAPASRSYSGGSFGGSSGGRSSGSFSGGGHRR